VLPLHSGHGSVESAISVADLMPALSALIFMAFYLVAVTRLRGRGDAWPWQRDMSFAAGAAVLITAALVQFPGGEFTVHVAQHLLVGMVAPMLLILARPLTLVLRSVHGGLQRTILAISSSILAWLVFPPAAAVINVAGLWLLYRTGLFAATRDDPWLHAIVHLHMFVGGLLFTFSVCQLDPLRRRHGLPLRAGCLVVAGAAHAVLAKTLYGVPPPGSDFALPARPPTRPPA
jgi:putative membrane protein